MVAWKTEHGVEFNVLSNYGPFLVQPIVQYYTNVAALEGMLSLRGLERG
jgi:hypothetical protein